MVSVQSDEMVDSVGEFSSSAASTSMLACLQQTKTSSSDKETITITDRAARYSDEFPWIFLLSPWQ